MNHREIKKEDFEKIYLENSSKEAAKALGISTTYLFKLVSRYKIKKKGKGNQIVLVE